MVLDFKFFLIFARQTTTIKRDVVKQSLPTSVINQTIVSENIKNDATSKQPSQCV